MDPYKILDISPNATDDEVKSAYRELARKYHPNNYEYQRTKQVLSQSAQYGGYRPTQGTDAMDCCTQLLCLNCLCDCMGGGC